MPDIPKLPAVQLHDEMVKVVKASDAVREGIATHAQKHHATREAKRARMDADAKLAQPK